eukprot:scaffold46557_cov70-Phaeocystis_antarctica.AAC.4
MLERPAAEKASRSAVHTSEDVTVSLAAGCLSTGERLAGRMPRCLPSFRRRPKRRLPSELKEQTTPSCPLSAAALVRLWTRARPPYTGAGPFGRRSSTATGLGARSKSRRSAHMASSSSRACVSIASLTRGT